MSYPADVFRAVARRETEVVGQTVPNVVAVEQISDLTRLDECALHRHGGGGLAGRR